MNKHSFAFPRAYSEQHDSTRGMTLRDYFAAKAMQGWLANTGHWDSGLAERCYKRAEEMLKARESSSG
jgi:ATP-dependent phosphoenolpyruvate carboxykinase